MLFCCNYFLFPDVEELPDLNEITDTIKVCIECNKNFKTDEELQSHVCSANQTNYNNPVYFIDLADSPDFDDENEMPNQLSSDLGDEPIKSQNIEKIPKAVNSVDSSKALDLESNTPIIIDDVNKLIKSKPISNDLNIETSVKNVPSKCINIVSEQNAISNVMDSESNVNSDISINPTVIIVDDDSTSNSEIVFRNEDDDNTVIDNSGELMDIEDNSPIELADEFINSENTGDSLPTSPPPSEISIVKENSEILLNFQRHFDYEELSKVLETVSSDINMMICSDDLENSNLNVLPILSDKKNYVTGVDVKKNVPNDNVDVVLLTNKEVNKTDAVKMKNLQELIELSYLGIEDVNSSIYLENGVEIEELDIVNDTENNMEGFDPKIVLENGMKAGHSKRTLENNLVSNVLENYVEVLDSKVVRGVGELKDVSENMLDLETVNMEDSIDVVDLDDANPIIEIEKGFEDVDPEAILENDEFDPKVLENCMDVFDPNVIEDCVEVIDLKAIDLKTIKELSDSSRDPNDISGNNFNFFDPNTSKQISNSVKVDNPNNTPGRDNANRKVALENNNNIVDSNNIQIECFTKDFEGNMQAVDSKSILENGIPIEVISPLDDVIMESVNTNPTMQINKQLKNEIIKTEKLPISVNNTPSVNLNILTDYDVTNAKPDLLSDPGAFKIPSNQHLCDLGKFVLEDVVYKKKTKNKVTKSKFNRQITKLRIKPITTANQKKEINQNSQTRDGDQSIPTDSMLDILTSNQGENTVETVKILDIVSDLEESITRDLYCRNVATNTSDDNVCNNIDKDDEPEKRKSLVTISMPPDGRSRFRKFRTKKTQTDNRRVKPSPQFEEEMREAGLLEQVRPPSEVFIGPLFKKDYKHICAICNSRYNRISRLQQHMRRHNKELKYKCEHCDHKFAVQYELDRHHRIVHLGNKKKGKLDFDSGAPLSKYYPHKCDYCRMFFQTTSGLMEHTKKRHAKEMYLMEANRPVECDVCKKKFIKSLIADHKAKAHALSRIVVLEQRELKLGNPIVTNVFHSEYE